MSDNWSYTYGATINSNGGISNTYITDNTNALARDYINSVYTSFAIAPLTNHHGLDEPPADNPFMSSFPGLVGYYSPVSSAYSMAPYSFPHYHSTQGSAYYEHGDERYRVTHRVSVDENKIKITTQQTMTPEYQKELEERWAPSGDIYQRLAFYDFKLPNAGLTF